MLNIADLRRAGNALGGLPGARIDETLLRLGNLNSDRREHGGVLGRSPSTALARLSTMLSHLPPSLERMEGMAAVMGLRLDLDPFLGSAP